MTAEQKARQKIDRLLADSGRDPSACWPMSRARRRKCPDQNGTLSVAAVTAAQWRLIASVKSLRYHTRGSPDSTASAYYSPMRKPISPIRHYIPEWVLKKFREPLLYELDIFTGKAELRQPKKAGSARDLWPDDR